MPDKPIRKGFNILEEVEEIQQKHLNRQPHKKSIDLVQSHLINAFRIQRSTYVSPYSAYNIWRELLMGTRKFTKSEFLDDISELRQEIDTLKLIVKSLTKTLASSNKTIEELSKEFHQKQTIRQKVETSLDKLCNAYIEMVSKIEIVKKIYIADTSNGLLCWTIVDAEPFDSTVLEPIYDAQVKIYRQMESTSALDFHVLNLSELHDKPELESILTPGANLVWQR